MCGCQDGTIVAAHSNLIEHGKGRGFKAHDGMTAWLCMSCHYQLDQGTAWTKSEKRLFILEAISKTYMKLWDMGLIQLKGTK